MMGMRFPPYAGNDKAGRSFEIERDPSTSLRSAQDDNPTLRMTTRP